MDHHDLHGRRQQPRRRHGLRHGTNKGSSGAGADSPNLFVYYDGNSPAIPLCIVISPNRENHDMSAHTKCPTSSTGFQIKQNENAADRRSILNFVDWCVNKVEVENERRDLVRPARAKVRADIFRPLARLSGHRFVQRRDVRQIDEDDRFLRRASRSWSARKKELEKDRQKKIIWKVRTRR